MIAGQEALEAIQPISLEEYVDERRRQGKPAWPGASPGQYWTSAQPLTLARLPKFELAPPSPGEIRQLFTRHRAALVSYVTEPDATHPANTWLYVCRNRAYEAATLDEPTRRNIRRAERELRFELLDWPVLRQHGLAAFRDSRLRNGLSDGTEAYYARRFEEFCRSRAHHVLGAWKGETLVAFMTMVTVDDWVEISGFSRTDTLSLRPNNGLIHRILTHFLRERGASLVTYGLSSVQDESRAEGLHQFKLKTGFEALPVHRAFVVHPLLRPLANRGTLALARLVLRRAPANPRLKKMVGALGRMVGDGPALDAD